MTVISDNYPFDKVLQLGQSQEFSRFFCPLVFAFFSHHNSFLVVREMHGKLNVLSGIITYLPLHMPGQFNPRDVFHLKGG